MDFILGDHTAIEAKAKRNVSAQDIKGLVAFGEEKLVEGLLARPRESVKEVVDGVFADVRRHAAGARQSDDITVVAVRRRPS